MARFSPITLALLSALGSNSPAGAEQPIPADVESVQWTPTEKFVWTKLQSNKMADLSELCPGATPSPEDDETEGWDCRTISADFLRDILVRSPWQEALPARGVFIKGARITNNLDLGNARLPRALVIINSVFTGYIALDRIRTDNIIELNGSVIMGEFVADGMHAGSDVHLRAGTSFRQNLSVAGAQIDGEMDMTGTSVAGELQATGLKVGNSLFLRSDKNHTSAFKDVDLSAAKIGGGIFLSGGAFCGILNGADLNVGGSMLMRSDENHGVTFKNVYLTGAKINGDLDLTGAFLSGYLDGEELIVGQSLYMKSSADHVSRFKDVHLSGSKIEGEVNLTGVTVEGAFQMRQARVGHSLSMQSEKDNVSTFVDVDLSGANVEAGIALNGATVSGRLDAQGLNVGQSLHMRSLKSYAASFKDVDLSSAKIKGQIDLSGATITGILMGEVLQVGDFLANTNGKRATRLKDVDLKGAKIAGQLSMAGASIDGFLDGDSLEVGQNLILWPEEDAPSRFEDVLLVGAKVGSNLDISGAIIGDLNLSQGMVNGEFRLGTLYSKSTTWRHNNGTPGMLTLRNAHVDTLSDDINAWPTRNHLKLSGFSLVHLGGSSEEESQNRNRGMEWWDDWARLDPDYTPTPYAQLAAALVAAGDRDAANEIRFLGREREREVRRERGYFGDWLLLTGLSSIAGYGIGTYSFRVLRWVFDLALFGTVILWFTVSADRRDHHGRVWCFFASLSRVLPVVEISKEFSEFFSDPKRERLDAWQSFIFSLLGIAGWVLGGVLVAAVAGLTQNP